MLLLVYRRFPGVFARIQEMYQCCCLYIGDFLVFFSYTGDVLVFLHVYRRCLGAVACI